MYEFRLESIVRINHPQTPWKVTVVCGNYSIVYHQSAPRPNVREQALKYVERLNKIPNIRGALDYL